MAPTAERGLDQLCSDLRDRCGVRAGDLLIIHSSAMAVGPVDDGVVTISRAIREVVTERGTVLVPTFCRPIDDGVFKIRRTPSIVGLVTESFRRTPGSIRSMHPTHSVVGWGRRAAELTAGHEKTSGLGVDSPFHKAAKEGAYILMIGCDLRTCSLVHVAEAILRVPYLGKVCYAGYDRTLTLIDRDGHAHDVPPRDPPGDSVAFTRVQDALEQGGLIRHGSVGQAETLRFTGADCLRVSVALLRQDPAALLCDKPGCPVCPPSRRIVEEYLAGGNPWPPPDAPA